jgi:hypothetical protein
MSQRDWKMPTKEESYPPRVEKILRGQSLTDLPGGKEGLVVRKLRNEVCVDNNNMTKGGKRDSDD